VHTHLTADFIGVPSEQLRDSALLGGLLIAAASAAGFSLSGVPIVREMPGGRISAMVLIDQGHLSVHALPDKQTLLFDAVASASHDFRKALDVLSRRLTARDIKTDTRGRG
jgi:S-adenosylmethionine/arginine decarboxylase-like enzyme